MSIRGWSAIALAALSASACGNTAATSPDAAAGGGSSGGAVTSSGGTGVSSSGDSGGDDDGGSSGAGTGFDATVQDAGSTNGDAGGGSSGGDDGASRITCGGPFLAPGDYVRTMSTDAGVRTYYVHVPLGAVGPGPAPLVLAFHGGGMTVYGDGGLGFELFAHVRAKSDASGFVLVEPEGTPALPLTQPGTLDVFNAGNCCEQAEQKNSNIDDVGFASAIIDAMGRETCIDTKRVFATGLSNGAMLSHRLACQLSDKIAAIAAVSGGLGNTDYDTLPSPTALFPCTPTRPVPILHIHGTQDACYPFDGGWGPLSLLTFESVPVTIASWVTRNGCDAAAPPTRVFDNGAASCFLYGCPKNAEVELCTIDGGGHYWPGGDD
ncbi:MAG: alpha/beta hydrolase family esterase, partial [Polyangiaceae bacterium]